MLNLISAEWTKLRSTASLWWNSGITILIAALYGLLFGWTAQFSAMPYVPLTVVATVALTTAIVVVVQQSMIVTTEYRFGIPATNFRIAPKRWPVAVAKLVVGAVIAAAVSFLGLVLAFTLADLTAPISANWPTNPATQRALWAVPLGMALLAMFTQGVGWLTRNTSGSIVAGLAVMLVLESIIGIIPRFGAEIVKFMPFGNLLAFMTNQPTPHWSVGVSLGIYALWALVVWAIGVIVLAARDV